MKKFCSAVLVASVIASLSANSFAMGIFMRPGAKANCSGGATGATSGDVTAICSNPAALSVLEGSGVMFSTYNLDLAVKASGAINGDYKVSGPIPFLAAYQSYNEYVFALGIYVPGGASGKADNVVMPTALGLAPVSVEGQQMYMAANFSVSRQITARLAAGLGVDFIYTSLMQKMSLAGLQVLDTSVNGNGYEFNGGVTYKISDNIRAGAFARSGALLRFKDSAGSSIIYPVVYGAGADFEVTEDLKLSAGADIHKYSSYADKWKDMPMYHAGALYDVNEKIYVGMGLQYELSAVSPEDVAVPLFDTNKFAETIVSLGTGYDFGKCRVSLLYAYGLSDKVTVAGTDYVFNGGTWGLDIAYKF